MKKMFSLFSSDSNFYKEQNYKKICSDLSARGHLFEDPHFPASTSSLGDIDIGDVVWKRPKDLCVSPRLFVPCPSPCGVKAGPNSRPWVVSACSIISSIPELYFRVVPDASTQDWKDDIPQDYLGIFYFHFWYFGKWLEVVVDDLLPTVKGKLIFTSSDQQNEFWIPLLEKAYAKLHGSYQNLELGHISDALVDFTGGIAEIQHIKKEGSDLNDVFKHLMEVFIKEINDHSIICLKIDVKPGEEAGTRTELGLHVGNEYQMTAAKFVSLGETKLQNLFSNRERIAMVRLRDAQSGSVSVEASNPDRGEIPENDNSSGTYLYSTTLLSRLLSRNPKWSQVKDTERQRLGLTFEHSGEFWMPLDDLVAFDELIFIRFFTNNAFALLQRWREKTCVGHWTQGLRGTTSDRSGGCTEFPDSVLSNPQYTFDVTDPEHAFVAQIIQWTGPDRDKFISEEKQLLLIGICIIKVENNRKYRLCCQWDFCPTVVVHHPVRKRQLFFSGPLATGRYILIPYTFYPGETGGFLLRTFSQTDIQLRLLKKDKPSHFCPNFLVKYPTASTVIVVEGAKRLEERRVVNSWVELQCERQKEKTPVCFNSSNPVWNTSFIFYRAKPEKPISIKVYCRHWLFLHILVGQAELPAVVNNSPTPIEVVLRDKRGEETDATLSLKILTRDNILCTAGKNPEENHGIQTIEVLDLNDQTKGSTDLRNNELELRSRESPLPAIEE